jgi:hypothetical protein
METKHQIRHQFHRRRSTDHPEVNDFLKDSLKDKPGFVQPCHGRAQQRQSSTLTNNLTRSKDIAFDVGPTNLPGSRLRVFRIRRGAGRRIDDEPHLTRPNGNLR